MKNLLTAGFRKLRGDADAEPRAAASRSPSAHRAHVVAIAAQKGGVGKTTTTVNLACALAQTHGARVLVIDIDPQGHVASSLKDAVRIAGTSLSDVLLAQSPRDLMDAVLPSDIENLSLTPPDKSLNETDTRLSTRVGREYILQAALTQALTRFDWILIDCPPNLGNLTLNALVAANHVLVPCDMSILAFEGVADLLGTVRIVNERLRHPLQVLGILRTRVDGRTQQINDAIGGALDDNYRSLLLETAIPVNSALAQAQAAGKSIFQYSPNSRGALAYKALAREVTDRLGMAAKSVGRAARA
jgi:chromosome partitioning protein